MVLHEDYICPKKVVLKEKIVSYYSCWLVRVG